MRAVSCLPDSRIDAHNVLVELSLGEYERLISEVVGKNVFQRRRVRSSKTVYSLLRADLTRQCVIPPVVLALTSEVADFNAEDLSNFGDILLRHQEDLVILDGLQRTYTILDLLADLREKNDEATLSEVESYKLRMEVYVGINRLGILYRMLTLNTGQTPMSLRQQIEILYLDYLDTEIDGVELIRETDDRNATGLQQYNFKDVIEGFNAYLDRDELPIDKADILENISSLEKLSKENQSTELFEKFLEGFSCFVGRASSLANNLELSEDYLASNNSPFGKNVVQIFKRPQAMSGFGAAVGKLIDFGVLRSFDEVVAATNNIEMNDPEAFLEEINNSLDWLKNNTKKIGNAQRSFFSFFFRDLFNPDSDGYLDLIMACKTALRKYQAQNL
jgi:hypothetical protein